jgi:hypothetical protein
VFMTRNTQLHPHIGLDDGRTKSTEYSFSEEERLHTHLAHDWKNCIQAAYLYVARDDLAPGSRRRAGIR